MLLYTHSHFIKGGNMSDENSKTKRNERIQQKENRLESQRLLAKLLGGTGKLEKSEHYYHKHNVMNCGRSLCWLCGNPRKTHNEKTIQEKKFEETKDWVDYDV